MTYTIILTDEMLRKFFNQHEVMSYLRQETMERFALIDCGQEPTKLEWQAMRDFHSLNLIVKVRTDDLQPLFTGGV